MKSLSIRVTAESPLSIRADHAPEGARGASYIPGTTLVGALAAAYRMLHPTQADTFERLFLHEQVLYPNLYPASFKDKIMPGIQGSDLPVYPIPKTAQSCKRHPGFRSPEDREEKAHGVHDSLIDWAIAKLGQAQKSSDPIAALRAHKFCLNRSHHNTTIKACNEVMDNFTGYYRRNNIKPYYNDMIKAHPNTRLRTHTGIDRETGTVEDGILYNREVFEEDMHFWGRIQFLGNNDLIKHFEDFINEASSQRLIRIGTGRTRGMGRVTIEVRRQEEIPNGFTSFQKRLEDLNDLLHTQAEVFKVNGQNGRFYFALTLHSPLILCDELLRYQGTIDEKALEGMLDYKIPGLQRIYQTASVSRITGWQEMWGLPRTNEYAIDTGSVFLFACTRSLDKNEHEKILRNLFKLEEQGAGKRQVEGFGHIRVSDQFHQEINLR